MTKRNDRFRPRRQIGDKAQPREVDQDGGPAERLPDGRFAPGHCPNPSGRPRKRHLGLLEVLGGILDGKISTLSTISADMTVREGLLRAACQKAFKDHKAALDILKLVERFQTNGLDAPLVENEDEDLRALERYARREARRLGLKQERPDQDELDDEEGGS